MSNVVLMAMAWLAVIAHVAIGVLAWRRVSELPLVVFLNLAVALGMLAYWVQQWYGYIGKGITWYAIDQLLPLYALLVAVLAGLTIVGRTSATLPHWLIFGIDAVALLGVALFATFFRMNRLF